MRKLLLLLGVMWAMCSFAAQESDIAPSNEPKVTIHEVKDKTIYEYRVNGFLYAIKIVPKNKKFPPYYLVAIDNKGNFTRSENPDMLIPQWKIFSW
jgi:hypothetical protein